MQNIPKDFLIKLANITAKRPKTVIDHILKHGHITTEELKVKYGYNHPPRGARDVREQGIPLETFTVVGTDKRKIAAYRFGDLTSIEHGKLGGRKAPSKQLKDKLIEKYGCKCAICGATFEKRYLQVDHRIPFEVAGETASHNAIDAFALLCGSCNRAKSWSCERCSNWRIGKVCGVCKVCYWADQENYEHVALENYRRADVVWQGAECVAYDSIRTRARAAGDSVPTSIKKIIEDSFSKNKPTN